MNVLIVDDSNIDISIIGNAIRQIDSVNAYVATGAIEAIELAAIHDIDLIILDVNMPNIDGIGLRKRLKRHHLTAKIPVIFITAEKGAEVDCYRAGCIEFLTKPVNMGELVEIVREQSFLSMLTSLKEFNQDFCKRLR